MGTTKPRVRLATFSTGVTDRPDGTADYGTSLPSLTVPLDRRLVPGPVTYTLVLMADRLVDPEGTHIITYEVFGPDGQAVVARNTQRLPQGDLPKGQVNLIHESAFDAAVAGLYHVVACIDREEVARLPVQVLLVGDEPTRH